MARPKVTLDRRGVSKLLKSDQMRPPLKEIADRCASRAVGSAPEDTGEYKSSISVESDTTDRAVERVVAHAAHATSVEAKTGNLKRALGG